MIFSDLGSFVAPCDGEKKVIFICFDGISELSFIRWRFPSFFFFFDHNQNGFPMVENKSRTDLPIKISIIKKRLDCVFINFSFKLVINCKPVVERCHV